MFIEIQGICINFNNVAEFYAEGSYVYIKYNSSKSVGRVFSLADDAAAETLYKFIKSKINNRKV